MVDRSRQTWLRLPGTAVPPWIAGSDSDSDFGSGSDSDSGTSNLAVAAGCTDCPLDRSDCHMSYTGPWLVAGMVVQDKFTR